MERRQTRKKEQSLRSVKVENVTVVILVKILDSPFLLRQCLFRIIWTTTKCIMCCAKINEINCMISTCKSESCKLEFNKILSPIKKIERK